MSVTRTEIFISSRFQEFADLRRELRTLINEYPVIPLEAVDLNDGMADAHPPLQRCLDAVDRSEVMILLVGETYGVPPEGEDLSYTHLEHKAALSEETDTVIIPFCIGPFYENKLSDFSSDPQMAAWQKEIKERHTPAFFHSTEDPASLAKIVFDSALKVLHEARSQEIRNQMAQFELEWDEDDVDVDNLSFDEITELGKLFADEDIKNNESRPLSLTEELLQKVTSPAKTAATEQQEDARRALEFGDRKGAIYHYKRSLDFDPWNIKICYSLARVLVSSSDKKECREALKLARRTIRIAEKSEGAEKDMYVSAAYILAAQASAKLDNYDEGLDYASLACERTPRFAGAKVELACQYAHRGDSVKVIEIAEEIYRMRYQSALILDREPSVQALGKPYQDYRKARLDKMRQSVSNALRIEAELIQRQPSIDQEEWVLSQNKISSSSLAKLIRLGQASAKRSLSYIQAEGNKVTSNLYKIKRLVSQANIESPDYQLHKMEEELDHFQSSAGFHSKIVFCLSATSALAAIVLFLFSNTKLYPLFPAVISILFLVFGFALHNKFKSSKALQNTIASRVKELKALVCNFHLSVQEFEKHIVNSKLLCPGSRSRRIEHGQLRRVDIKFTQMFEEYDIDRNLLPLELSPFLGTVEEFSPRIMLFQVQDFRGPKTLLRWKTYNPYWG